MRFGRQKWTVTVRYANSFKREFSDNFDTLLSVDINF